VDRSVAELYDLHETYTDDVELVRRLIGERGPPWDREVRGRATG